MVLPLVHIDVSSFSSRHRFYVLKADKVMSRDVVIGAGNVTTKIFEIILIFTTQINFYAT